MEFKELLGELEGVLPEMALRLLPLSLSKETQHRLCALTTEEAGRTLIQVIDLINRGSVETIESLTKEALDKNPPSAAESSMFDDKRKFYRQLVNDRRGR